MEIFDSNVWIHGLVGDCEEAVALLDEVLTNPIHVAVNAYIFDEVMQNLARADLAQDVIDSAQTEFATIVHGSHTVHGPTQDELRQMDVEAHRRDPRVEMIGEPFDIQPKESQSSSSPISMPNNRMLPRRSFTSQTANLLASIRVITSRRS